MQGTLAQAHRPSPEAQHKVLLVDDDAVSLEILALMLGFDGHEVLRAADGESALALLAHPDSKVTPDVLLVDMQMPGISGHELLERVRAMEGPRPLLLGMSATALNTQQLRGLDGFLLKPPDLDDLRKALEPPGASRNGRRRLSRNGFHAQSVAESSEHLAGSSKPRAGLSRPPAGLSKTATSKPDRDLAAERRLPGRRKRGSRRGSGQELAEAQPINPINQAVLTKLRNAMPLESLQELYAACLADSRNRAITLQALAREGSLAKIPREAHQIKGAASMVGADRITRLATALELGSCKKEDTLLLLNNLLDECEELERILLAGKLDQSHDDSDQ